MATTTSADENTTESRSDDPPTFRLKAEVEVPFKGAAPSPAEIRALLTPMAVEETEPGVYRVIEHGNEVTTNVDKNTCTCNAGTSSDEYKCRHIHHIKYRRESGTLVDPPEREDPVEKRARESKPVAEASRKREEQTQRGGGVTAGPGELLLQCAVCEEYTAIPEVDGVDTSVAVCPSCPPTSDSIVYLEPPRNEEEGSLVAVRDVVDDEAARSYYPGDESVFSLADMFERVDGVDGGNSVVLVSEPAEVEEDNGYLVFEEGTRAVPQGALRNVVSMDNQL